jgi:tetratricopeptide (TPR) repeat protein
MSANRTTACRRITSLLIGLLLAGCATPDFYDRRAQAIEEHHKEFHTYLEKNRLEDAIFENEHIEAIASELATAIKKRGRPLSTKQVDQEWLLLNKATSAAVENRLALGKHLAGKKKYEQAIIVYDRLIDNYGDNGGTCRSRAMDGPDKFNLLPIGGNLG